MPATNVFQNPTFISNEALRRLKNRLVFLKNTRGSEYASRFTDSPKKGETISVRLPNQVTTRSGETYTVGNHLERVTTMTTQTTLGVDLEFTNRELMFNAERFAERVIEPAMVKLADSIESTALGLAYLGVANYVGTPGTVPTSLKTYNQARAELARAGAPSDGHIMLISPDMSVEGVETGKGLFNPDAIARQYTSGVMSEVAGAIPYETNLLPVHTTTFALAGAVAEVKGAAQIGTTTSTSCSLITDGWTTKPTVGTVITLEDVYEVNHETKVSTGRLRKFVITASPALVGDVCTLTIRPSIITTGAYQNVDAGPADNADLTIWAASAIVSPQALYYHPEAFLFCTFDQPTPPNKTCRLVSDPDTGLKIRYIQDWDTSANKDINRFDVVWAWGLGQTEFACRIAS